MCGIAGIFRTDGAPVEPGDLRPMLEALAHRGPDGSGVHTAGSIGLGMTRLAIIDVAGGHQPILNEDQSLALVCNGEIYNYPVLRKELEALGHRFRTRSDVEVILHLYEESGLECFARLNGMFAVALADMRAGTVILARDRFGQKPLYLWPTSGRMVFASEIKALAQLPGFSRRPSSQALAEYLQFRYVPAPHTIFEGVEKLPPGTCSVIDQSGSIRPRRYWQIDFSPARLAAVRENPQHLRQRLRESVERHLMSERPLGVFLSGGLDSAAVVACMHELGRRDIHTFTVGFEDFEDNEFATARAVARRYETHHREVLLSPGEFWETLGDVVHASDEPLADLTTVPLYHLAREASRELVVVLSGEGSDELLAGYPGSEDLRVFFDRQRALHMFAPLARGLVRAPWPERLGRGVRAVAGTASQYLAAHPISMTAVFDERFRARNGRPEIAGNCVLDPLARYFAGRPEWDGVHLYLGGLIEWWLPDDLLHKADRMTMAHSIELRCPFLDTEFSTFCAGLCLDDKVVGGNQEPNRKIILKRAFQDVLPPGIAMQRKRGFVVPVYSWLKDRYYEHMRSELGRSEALGSSLFDSGTREQLLQLAAQGDQTSQHRVWSLVILNKWGDCWL